MKNFRNAPVVTRAPALGKPEDRRNLLKPFSINEATVPKSKQEPLENLSKISALIAADHARLASLDNLKGTFSDEAIEQAKCRGQTAEDLIAEARKIADDQREQQYAKSMMAAGEAMAERLVEMQRKA